MLKKRVKKGQMQMDWAMSLAIFLLYISWFFLFIRPNFAPPTDLYSLFSLAEDGFRENTTWSNSLMPVFVKNNITSVDEPVIAGFAKNWLVNNTAFKDKRYFVIDEEKLLFLSNLSEGRTIFWLAHSPDDKYTMAPVTKDLHAGDLSASVNKNGFRADFKDGLLSSMTYNGKTRVEDFGISINSQKIKTGQTTNSTFNLTSITAKYKMESPMLNHTSYIFAENTKVYSYASSSQNTGNQNTLTLSFSISNYTNYYSSSAHSGMLAGLEDCDKYTDDYVDFYDSSGGLTIITDKDANITLCYDLHLDAEITIPFNNKTEYKVLLHMGNYENTLQYVNYMTTQLGATDNTTGLSLVKINATNQTEYSALKKQWGFPNSRELSFMVLNASGSVIYDYSPEKPPSTANVYVKEWHDYILDKYGAKTRYKIRVKVW